MNIHYSLEAANAVLKLINKKLPKKFAKGCTLKVWANGREQGYCIDGPSNDVYKNTKKLVFAQQRNSDYIVVVAGTVFEFDEQNQPSELLWNTGFHLPTHGYEGKGRRDFETHNLAADRIVSYLTAE